MPILCLEGPSAVGKSTTSNAMVEQVHAYAIPEVNALFARPTPEQESPTWYFERQVDRWQIAVEQAQTHRLVLLDGDPFQPLWYNWSYRFVGWQSLAVIADFYRQALQAGQIAFPDTYVVLQANLEALRDRKEQDQTRSRRNFEKHLSLVENQKQFFQALAHLEPSLVHFVSAESIASNCNQIQTIATALEADNRREARRQLELFDRIIDWLEHNEPLC